MSEVVAESVQTQSDGTLWAITVQTVDAGDFGFEVEEALQKPPCQAGWNKNVLFGFS